MRQKKTHYMDNFIKLSWEEKDEYLKEMSEQKQVNNNLKFKIDSLNRQIKFLKEKLIYIQDNEK